MVGVFVGNSSTAGSYKKYAPGRGERGEVGMSKVFHKLGVSNFYQDWSNTSLITTAGDWSNVPSIMGFRGDAMSAPPGKDARLALGDGTVVANITPNLTSTGNSSGGIAEF